MIYKILITFTFLFVTQIFAKSNNRCNVSDLPLDQAGDKFYYVELEKTLNWYKAFQFCRQHGMELVSIENDNEIKELNVLVKKLGFRTAGIWTSGSDLAEYNKYVWMGTGKTFELSKSSWHPGEPNHSHNGEEHCIGLWNSEIPDYLLNDYMCDLHLYFICENVCDN